MIDTPDIPDSAKELLLWIVDQGGFGTRDELVGGLVRWKDAHGDQRYEAGRSVSQRGMRVKRLAEEMQERGLEASDAMSRASQEIMAQEIAAGRVREEDA